MASRIMPVIQHHQTDQLTDGQSSFGGSAVNDPILVPPPSDLRSSYSGSAAAEHAGSQGSVGSAGGTLAEWARASLVTA